MEKKIENLIENYNVDIQKFMNDLLYDLEDNIISISVELYTGGDEDKKTAIETLNKLKEKINEIINNNLSSSNKLRQELISFANDLNLRNNVGIEKITEYDVDCYLSVRS